jgi:4-amino-4-deoxy-L-arabinose transferase-like glycosyltransferase
MVQKLAHRNSQRFWLAALAVLFLLAVFLVRGIQMTYMRADESLVYDFTNRSLPDMVRFLVEQDVHPPLWFGSFWLWRQFMGDSEWIARVYTVLVSLVTLALVYQIGRRWFGLARAGIMAMALLGSSAFFFIFALEIRPYGHIMLAAALSMWTFERWLARRTTRSAVYYGLTLPLMLYIHYFLFVLIIVQGLYFGVYAARLLRRERPAGWALLRSAWVALLVAGALWLPWMPAAINQVLHLRATDTAGGTARGVIGSGATTIPTSWRAVQNLALLATNGLVWLYAGLLLVGVALWWRRAAFWLALAWALAVPAVSLLLNLFLAVYLPRYVVYMAVGLALAAAAALARAHYRARWSLLAGAVALALWGLPAQISHDHPPLRDLYRQVSAAAGPDDVILFDRGGWHDGFVRGQVRRYLDPALWARRVNSLEEALTHRRIWYVTDQEWFTETTRQRFHQIEQSHPLQQVIGRCDREWCYLLQLLEAPPHSQPWLFGPGLAFYGLDVDEITPDIIHTRLWWSVAEPLALDYSIGLHLLDDMGVLVAQADGPITDFYSREPVQTSQLAPGQIRIDARALRLPADLPAGVYRLALVVYQSWDGVRLSLPDGTDALPLDEITLSGA